MARLFAIFALIACLILSVSAMEGSFERHGEIHVDVDPNKAIGTAGGAALGAVVPTDANHAACEELGFMDEDLKTGDVKAANTGIWGFAKSLATTLVPNKALRQACISMGYFHPKE